MPPVALLTDFGVTDPYVGIMKGVIAGVAPDVPVIDVTHGVPPQDVRTGALFLDAAWPYFPESTVFVCVVDPGVGTPRRPLAASAAGRLFVGPDNGLLSLLPRAVYRELAAPWGLPTRSRTFHGRDLFAPAAARLAAGTDISRAGPVVDDIVRLRLPVPDGDTGEVLWIDTYGNAVTNLPGKDAGHVVVGEQSLPVVRAYGEVPVGTAVALTGSTGRLEVSVREGNAAQRLGLRVGSKIAWRTA